MAVTASGAELGTQASDFDLQGTDGRRHGLSDVRGPTGTLVMFLCNHCPYVQAVLDDVIRDVRELRDHGIGAIAVMPNDTEAYPADAFDKMQELARARNFPFPYVIDPTQKVARAYGAVCTPDFFGFNADLELQYRGRIYPVQNRQRIPGSQRELFDAMREIARTGRGPATQYPSIGCSIKWRDAQG